MARRARPVLRDLWTGTSTAACSCTTCAPPSTRGRRYGQRAWLRQLDLAVTPEMEAALFAHHQPRMDGTPFPATAALAGRWIAGRRRRPANVETTYCAEVVAATYQAMGLLGADRPTNYFDPGSFWSGDELQLLAGARLGDELRCRTSPGDLGGMGNVYTHGHHESVLRSHRWRTADNSAAYLLATPAAGMRLLDVGRGPGTITVDLAAAVAPGRVTALERTEARLTWRARGREPRLHNVEFVVGDVQALDFAALPSTWCTPTRCCSTSATRCGAARDAPRLPARRTSRPRQRLQRVHLVPGDAGARPLAGAVPRVARANGGEPDAGGRLLAWAERRPGFSEVDGEGRAPGATPSPEGRAWWGGLWADRVVGLRAGRAGRSSGASRPPAGWPEVAAGWRRWAAARRRLVQRAARRGARDPLTGGQSATHLGGVGKSGPRASAGWASRRRYGEDGTPPGGTSMEA